MKISDYYSDSATNRIMRFPLRFISHDGYYPLLIIPTIYRGTNNPYFIGSHNNHNGCRISNRLSLESAGRNIKYKIGRSLNAPVSNLFSGFFSMLGTKEDFEYMPSSLSRTDDLKYRMKSDIDIFCLGVIKLTDLSHIGLEAKNKKYKYSGNEKWMDINLDLNKVKILINEEKLNKSRFMKDHYTATVRQELLLRIHRLTGTTKITTKDVSDDYLEKFVISPNTVRTNSMVKVIQMSNEIKDSVFSNLKVAVI